jgi:predicted nucleic acid-binding protein
VALIVADTDVLIDYLQDAKPAASRIALELRTGRLATTVITRFELLAGAKGRRKQRIIEELLAGLSCLALEADAADRAAEVRRSLEAAGTTIGMADSLIAGIVLANDAILLTRNRRHFELVQGLTLGTIT